MVEITEDDFFKTKVEIIEKSSFLSILVHIPNGKLIREAEKELIRLMLIRYQGNKSEAAAALGISTSTLRTKLNEYKECGETKWETVDVRDIDQGSQAIH